MPKSLGMASERTLDLYSMDISGVPPPWSVGFSRRFKKDTEGMDRKIMGRILEVLEEMTDYGFPFRAKGDTFKPLVGELDGCWRYRLGDSRLIIQPKVNQAQINAIAFAARGSVYD
jgi:mRNA-degrading endonuclease RelE of RelBE toxin-antitoxin system